MAIGFRATGAWVATTANQTVTIPAGTVSGDLMVMFYGTKPFNDVPTIDQGWTDGGAATDGTVGAGVDVGSMQARIFWKVHTGTETNPTVTNASNNVSSVVIVSFSKDPAKSWDLVLSGGGDNTAGTAFSATTAANIDLAVNDWVASFMAIRSDAGTPGTFTTTATGITFGTFVSQPTAAFATQSGGDMAARSGYNTVTAGTGTTTITVASTLAAAHTGSMYLIRMREVDPPLADSFDPFGMLGFFGM
jgi:hypothetical protein